MNFKIIKKKKREREIEHKNEFQWLIWKLNLKLSFQVQKFGKLKLEYSETIEIKKGL